MANLFAKMKASCPMNFIKGVGAGVGIPVGIGAAAGAMRGNRGDRSMGGRARGALGGAAVGGLGVAGVMGYNRIGGMSGLRGMMAHPGLAMSGAGSMVRRGLRQGGKGIYKGSMRMADRVAAAGYSGTAAGHIATQGRRLGKAIMGLGRAF